MLDAGFENIVKKIAEERGKDIFLEPNKLKSLLLDYAKNEYKKECSLLMAILDIDSVNSINRAENLEECKQFLVKRLEDEHSLSPQKSAEMLDLLFLVLHGVKLEPILFDSDVSQLAKISMEKINTKPKLRLLHTFKANFLSVNSIAFSPNGKYIISGEDKGLKLWSIESKQLIHNMHNMGHDPGPIFSVAFNPTGEYVIAAEVPDYTKLWDIKKGYFIRRFGPFCDIDDGYHNSVAFSPDGKYFISGCCDGTVKLWDVWEEDGKDSFLIFKGHEKEVISVAFSPNGHYIISLSCDNTIKLWNVKDSCLIRTFIGHEKVEMQEGSVSFNPNGIVFVSGASDGIKLWNVESEYPYPIFSTTINDEKNVKNITSIAFSPMGDYIISGSSDGSLLLWKIENNRFIIKTMEMHDNCVTSVAFSPDCKYIASASYNGTVKLWGLV